MSTMRKTIIASLLLFAASTLAWPQAQAPTRGPSTAEERARFLALTRKLEETPLDKSLHGEVKWALKWIEDIPDISVNICPLVLGGDFLNSHYRHSPQIVVQVIFGNVALLIEHPDKKNDQLAQYTAGVESALRAYKSILRTDREASPPLDDLLKKQSEGKLVDFVREQSKGCQTGDQTGS